MEPTTDPRNRALVQPTVLRVLAEDGSDEALPGQLSYRCQDPYAVCLVVGVEGAGTFWTFARSLLAGGLVEPTGDGDVHVFPGETEEGEPLVLVELTGDSEVLLGIARGDVEAFLATSYRLVPAGAESGYLDVDAAIAAILGGAREDRPE